MLNKLSRLAFIASMAPLVAFSQDWSSEYPAPWREDAEPTIIRTLLKNNVNGCGQFQWRRSATARDEFLIYCTRDGRAWTAFQVWPSINKVLGPYRTSASLPP